MNLRPVSQVYPLSPFKIDYSLDQVVESLSHNLSKRISSYGNFSDIVVLCIGTDRSTGDALGPLVGTKLQHLYPSGVNIYGTIDEPVHAINLKETVKTIQSTHHHPLLIAIDACLGQLTSVGNITVAHGPVKPGAGVKKDLPEVGTFHITGIVNIGGFMEYFVLQNTRLSVVMKMADVISHALYLSVSQIQNQSNIKSSTAF